MQRDATICTHLRQSHTVMEAMETIGCAGKGTATWQLPCVAVLE
jgi:hypothetical protein